MKEYSKIGVLLIVRQGGVCVSPPPMTVIVRSRSCFSAYLDSFALNSLRLEYLRKISMGKFDLLHFV